jgi:UDP-GlcNAc:undecaprenyl-phosphate GlcNAc-1-phosphate transferase
MDQPDGMRKLHAEPTPLVGGIAMLIPSFAMSLLYFAGPDQAPFILVSVVGAGVSLILGIADDRWGLSPVWRLLVLTFVIFIAFSLDPTLVLHHLRLAIFHQSLSFPLDPLAAPVMAFVILGFVNAVSMTDGMDGQLLGSIIIWSSFIAWYLGPDLGGPFVILISSSIVVLAFNLRGKLFTGSSGAYAAALFIAFGTIAAYRHVNGPTPAGPDSPMSASVPTHWFWLPVLDCLRLMATRSFAGRSPLSGDRNHFHHMLLRRMPPHHAVIVYLALLAAPGAGAMLNRMLGNAALAGCLAAYATFVVLDWRAIRERQKAQVRSADDEFSESRNIRDLGSAIPITVESRRSPAS